MFDPYGVESLASPCPQVSSSANDFVRRRGTSRTLPWPALSAGFQWFLPPRNPFVSRQTVEMRFLLCAWREVTGTTERKSINTLVITPAS